VIKDEKGITLVEILAAITIFFMIIGAIFTVLLQADSFLDEKLDQYIKEGDTDRTKMVVLEMTSNVVELKYTQGEEIIIRSLNNECFSLRRNSEQQSLHYYSSQCNDVENFSYGNGNLLLKEINSIRLFEHGEKELKEGKHLALSSSLQMKITGKEEIRHSFRFIEK